MKKIYAILISLALLMSVVLAPVYAGGGKNHGSEAQDQAAVNQGEFGNGDSPGDNALGNQAP